MRKEQKSEAARIVLYSLCSLIVGCAVGGALLMKIAVQGDALLVKGTSQADSAPEEPVTVAEPMPEIEIPETVEPVVAEPEPPDAEAIRTLLKPAEPLLTVSYCYTDSDSFESHQEMFGKKVPFTTSSVILTFDGTVSMGIDPEAILYTVDPQQKTIAVNLPAPELLSHDLDEDSIQYYDVKSSIFRSASMADYTALLKEIKSKMCDKIVRERKFDKKTLDNAETVIRSMLAAADLTKDYTPLFARPESAAAEPETTSAPAPETAPQTEPAVPAETEPELEEAPAPFAEQAPEHFQEPERYQGEESVPDWPFAFWW